MKDTKLKKQVKALEIIQQVKSGDVNAYAEIVRMFQGDIWKMTASMLYSRSETEDLTQRIFIRAYEKLDLYDPAHDFKTWLTTLARNLVFQHLRKHSRQNRHITEYQANLAEKLKRGVFLKEINPRMNALKECKKKLNPEQKFALEQKYHHAKDFETLAASMNKSVEGTRQFLFRIRLTLKDCIEKRLALA